jgi:hypothetical protein
MLHRVRLVRKVFGMERDGVPLGSLFKKEKKCLQEEEEVFARRRVFAGCPQKTWWV